jgi:hypothetical protein
MSFGDSLSLMMSADDGDGRLSFAEWKMTMRHLKRKGELKSILRDPLFSMSCGFLLSTVLLVPLEVLAFETKLTNEDHLWYSVLA